MKSTYKFICFLMIITMSSCFDSGESSSKDLNASISFTGTQIVITNNDDFTWYNADITLNGKYKLKGNTLYAGETYTVGILQFADRDGNRFSSMMKPQEVEIWCDLGDGKNGFFYGSW